MSDELYIKVTNEVPDNMEGPHSRADVILNGAVVISAWAPNYGIYSSEVTSAKSAVALARIKFNQLLLADIRDHRRETHTA